MKSLNDIVRFPRVLGHSYLGFDSGIAAMRVKELPANALLFGIYLVGLGPLVKFFFRSGAGKAAFPEPKKKVCFRKATAKLISLSVSLSML